MFEFTLNRTVLRTPLVVPDYRVTVISIPGRNYRTHQSPEPALRSRCKHSNMVEEFGDLFLDGEYYKSPVSHHLYMPRAKQRNNSQKQQVFSPWKMNSDLIYVGLF
ncbi:hypothetical protein E2C01_055050 [Portunus trituberculatus]|uniref:Uncharacterized protein n=1 Tax=Portunus trituberculatus TaxID=210409 RepID=A0A5B7GVJ7_PORTR|nr:hypothetical protein [Portunus trituberculatus]